MVFVLHVGCEEQGVYFGMLASREMAARCQVRGVRHGFRGSLLRAGLDGRSCQPAIPLLQPRPLLRRQKRGLPLQ